MTFRRKPTTVEAFQWDPAAPHYMCPDWFMGGLLASPDRFRDGGAVAMTTIHGEEAIARPGDWIVREREPGRFYPVKPDIFAETYEPA